MKWTIQELRKIKDNVIQFDDTFDLRETLMERDRDIIDVSPVHVTGQLLIEPSDYLALVHVEGSVTLPSTRSLEPVVVPLSFDFDEMYMTEEQDSHRPEALQEELIIPIEHDTIDLMTAVADNILLNFPIQVLSEEEEKGENMPKGQGWEVISEADFNQRRALEKEETVDPRLAKLSSLFDNEDEK